VDSAVVRASSRIPHSVAMGLPEWSHETCSSSPDRRRVGVYATNGCIALPGRLERAYTPPGDIHHHPSTYEVLSSLCPEFPWVSFGGFGSCSSLEAEGTPRDGKPNPTRTASRGEFGNRVEGTRFNMTTDMS
jgi:hypothetical protein